ncbi:MAG: UDP-glucose 4-epimerase GalE [Candidatus Melainabacteria bacterium]|jgi:UDP-glucose 4-epimerase
MTTLITGGCGYIGSHVVKQLSESGHNDLIVLDNLSTGSPEALLHNETLLKHDLADTHKLESILKDNSIKSIIHFAASIVVPESVSNPIKYYSNNTLNTLNLLKGAVNAGVENFIFSSTAAVYGIPNSGIAFEETATLPINPYGWSKLMTEQIIQDIAAVHKLKFCILRYFNVAGADSQSRIGQRTPNATHLIKVACQAATGKGDSVSIFGTDYPTPDGTAIRDYIHVDDLASAHLLALSALEAGTESGTFNVGYGRGSSVREVIEQVKKVSGKDFKVIESPRRAGDPPNLIAQSDKIRNKLKWKPQFDNLETIVRDAWNWEQKLMREKELLTNPQ